MAAARNLGMQLLGVWLIAHAVLGLGTFAVPGLHLLMAGLAFAAGLLILIGR
jgi:cytochrome b subunit of formate dehydrogenase